MATTTNYSWTTPDDTDLVKDGAAAIRTLGSSIDTTVFNNAGAAVAKSTIDAKGDLLVGTANDTVGRLAVGTDGYTLVADSVETTGLKWVAPAGGAANFTLVNAGGTALTGAQTVTVSGISGADQLFVYIVGASSVNAGSFINLRFNADTGGNYNQYGVSIFAQNTYAAGNLDTAQGSGNASYRLGRVAANATGAVQGYALISGANSSGIKVIQSAGAGNPDNINHMAYIAGGFYNSASTISSVSIFSTSGNLDDGTVFVYKA